MTEPPIQTANDTETVEVDLLVQADNRNRTRRYPSGFKKIGITFVSKVTKFTSHSDWIMVITSLLYELTTVISRCAVNDFEFHVASLNQMAIFQNRGPAAENANGWLGGIGP